VSFPAAVVISDLTVSNMVRQNIETRGRKPERKNQTVGARRSRRFTARVVGDVCESQALRTLKRPEGRAPFATHDLCFNAEDAKNAEIRGENQAKTLRPFAFSALFAFKRSVIQSCKLGAPTTKIWTAVAACRGEAQRRLERSGDTAFRTAGGVQKRRGASLPAAVQNPWLRHKLRWVNPCQITE
jgi:hypothetical protein